MELNSQLDHATFIQKTGLIKPKKFIIYPYLVMSILLICVILNLVDSSLSANNRFYLCILVLAPTSFVLLNLIPFRCQACDSVVFYSFDHCCTCGEGIGNSKKDVSKIDLNKLGNEVRKRIFFFWVICLALFLTLLMTS